MITTYEKLLAFYTCVLNYLWVYNNTKLMMYSWQQNLCFLMFFIASVPVIRLESSLMRGKKQSGFVFFLLWFSVVTPDVFMAFSSVQKGSLICPSPVYLFSFVLPVILSCIQCILFALPCTYLFSVLHFCVNWMPFTCHHTRLCLPLWLSYCSYT